ncbi:cAMP-activated global transcriptional regulator CRP [Flavobacterium sp. ACN2]|jgi:CRP-like cAMP-binding protein|uniref:Crp/Fnr family transcriptional regulator n=1 Tax=unclassified Flavobacterium TaxID=196869 RepID=UPI000BB322DD|nr:MULTISPECIES: Crp/Fnr family transcriptional regulator [unclassified Flavobacterium]MDY0989594.1 Crp/Fnr family transcriptional regulator [Flavobacterium sp. CFBP9031]PBI87875.1 cAMP-activated global transcriptional regulator CRP [Flavobacterium sp. ACN2]
MHIDTDLLYTWGAVAKKVPKNSIIFFENDAAISYYQILEGTVKMSYTNEDGKDLTVGIFNEGNSFGEPPLFIGQPYPASAIAQTDCIILKLSKTNFFSFLEENSEMQFKILKLFAWKIYNKIVFSKNIVNHKPEYRIQYFLDNLKKQQNIASSMKMKIPYTRQEIADFTGLRVETVIRTLSLMNKNKKIEIVDHKLFY